MTKERELSDKEVSEIISEIKNIRTAKNVHVTSKGALYVRPIDIIVSDSTRDIIEPPAELSSGKGRHCD